MKKITIALVLAGAFFFLVPSARSQTQTNVTATVKDSNGIPYAGGTYSIQLIPTGTNPSVNGQGIGGAFNGSLDANGSFNVSLWPNGSITPGGTTWQFTICSNPGGIAPPLGTGTQCTPPTVITISGTSQNLSTTLSTVAPKLTNFITSSSTIGGSIANTQIAVGSGPNTIGGSPALTSPSPGEVFINNTGTFVPSEGNPTLLVGPAFTGLPTDLVQPQLDTEGINLRVKTPVPGGFGSPSIALNVVNQGAAGAGVLALNLAASVSGNSSAGTGAEEDCYASPGLGNTVSSCTGMNGGTALATVGTLTNAVGLNFEIDTEAAGTITNATNFNVPTNQAAGGGSFGTIYGVRHQAQTAGGTANYQDYFDDEGAGANNYGIFQAGTNTKNTLVNLSVTGTCTGCSSIAGSDNHTTEITGNYGPVTLLASGAATGFYLLTIYTEVSTGVNTSTITVNTAYQDDTGAQTQNGALFSGTTTGTIQSLTFPVRFVTGTALTYSTTTANSPKYKIFARVQAL